MKTIVIGLGNPILGDDGVGWIVAEQVRKQLASGATPHRKGEKHGVAVECFSLGGISLMERLIGYERAILIDALDSDQETGAVVVLKLHEMLDYSAFHISSMHDTSLQNALKLGKSLGASLPDDVTVVGIATSPVYDFSEELSPAVAAAVPKAVEIVMDLLA